MNRTLRSSLFAAAAGLVALAAPADRVAFHPAEGTELTKTFESRLALALEDLFVEINGEEIDPAMMGADFDLDSATMEATISMEVADTYVKVGEDRPLELLRSFVQLGGEYEDGFGNTDSSEDDELVGTTVRFVWSEDAEAYVASFAGDGGDEELLSKLSEDMDLRALLPGGPVSDGDSWRVSWAENLSLVMPGFDLEALGEFVAEQAEEEGDEVPIEALESLVEQFHDVFADAIALCTYRGTREVDGKRLGVVSIESEIVGEVDLVSVIEEAMAAQGEEMPEGSGFDDFSFALVVDLTGELLWDLSAGHVHSMNLEGELDGEVNVDLEVAEQGMELAISATVEISGELGRSVTTD